MLLTHLEHCEELTKPMLEAYLELFTVLFLKSDDVVKEVVTSDLISLLESLKNAEISLFAEKKFSMKIVLYRIYQLKHCVKQSTDCEIKKSRNREYNFSENPTQCKVHDDFKENEAVINLTHKDGKVFIPIICFLLTLTGKILNLNSAALINI